MKETKTEWIGRHNLLVDLAIAELTAAKKERVAGYDERLRKLHALKDVFIVKQTDTQDDLFSPKEILSPDLDALLSAPLHGLD